MLKNIPDIVSPQLMKTLMEMGHGDEICFADANFPAHSCAKRLVRADGHDIEKLLEAVLVFLPLDVFSDHPVMLMKVVKGHDIEPTIWDEYKSILNDNDTEKAFDDFEFLERFDFYERAKNAFAVVATSEYAAYGNIILRKGVILK